MKIKCIIFLIAFLLIILSFSHVYAIDMFLNSSIITNNETVLEEENTYEELLISDNSNESSSILNPAPTVTHTSSSDNALSISDIINIILISVCIVLIFLGIAILIRCK